MGDRGHNRHGPKRRGDAVPLLRGKTWVLSDNVAWAEVYFRTKWHLHPFRRLATIDMGIKLGGCAPYMGKLLPYLTQRRLGRGLALRRLAAIDIGRKLGAVSFYGGDLGPHLAQCCLGRDLPPCQVAS